MEEEKIYGELDNLRRELDYFVLYEPKNETAITRIEKRIKELQKELENKKQNKMEELNQDELNIIYEALKERSAALDEASRRGISSKLRKVASEEYKENNKVWEKIERKLIALSNKK